MRAPERVHPRDEEIVNHSGRELVVVAKQRFGAGRLIADLRHGDSPILPGRLTRDFDVVDTVEPHGDVFTALRHGTYLIATRTVRKATATDVATVHIAGSREDVPIPSAPSEIRFTTTNHLAVPNPIYAESALYIANNGTRTVQIRLYRLSGSATSSEVAAFTSHPTWTRLARLPVISSFDVATLAPGRWVSDGDLPSTGRYVALAAPLQANNDHRPELTRTLVAAVRVKD